MQPLTPNDLWPLPVYEGVRDRFRSEVIAHKRDRRVGVGPWMTFVFENRLTVKFQVQEILRIERISSEEGVREELDGFNAMLPGKGELSATLLIELNGTDAEVKAKLATLVGLRDHVFLAVAGERVRGVFDEGREDDRRVSAVQYVRFRLPPGVDLRDGPAVLGVDHPAYDHRQELSGAVRRALAQDLEAP